MWSGGVRNGSSDLHSYKYLGVCITHNMSWNIRINHISANTNFMLGYLKQNVKLAPVSLKLLLFKTLVRSKLEYAAAIWGPCHSILVSNIEAVQNLGARLIFCN